MMKRNMELSLKSKMLVIIISLILLLSITMLSVVFYETTKIVDESIYSQLNSNINLGYNLLDKKYPGEWKVEGGRLFKGNKLINGDTEFVDEFKAATDSPATIFLGDTRIATNVLKEGKRAIGTKVSNEVADMVLNQGKEFVGEANVVNKRYMAKYVPIKDAGGQIIGIWFTGVEKGIVNSKIRNLMYINCSVAVVIIIMAIIILFIFANILNKNIKRILETLRSVSSGDLSKECNVTSKDEIRKIAENINYMTSSMRSLIQEMKDKSRGLYNSSIDLTSVSKEMSDASETVASAIQDIAKGSGVQAQDLSYISGTLNNFGRELDDIAIYINDIDRNSSNIGCMASESNNNMESLIKSIYEMKSSFEYFELGINKLGENINQINEITAVINDVANQTNLLALNAAIEAARAGEAGRGFSIVADEIRKLAEQSKDSSKTISTLIDNISQETTVMVDSTGVMSSKLNNQLDDINMAINSFKNIITSINEIIPQIQKVSSISNSVSNEKNQILEKVGIVDSVAQEVSASSEEIAASSQEMNTSSQGVAVTADRLSNMTTEMLNHANKFKL